MAHGFLRAADGTITTFDALGGAAPGQGTYAAAINASGVVTGWYVDGNGVYHGFALLPDDNITIIDVPGAGADGRYGQGTVANSINDAGSIAGYYLDGHNVFHGFVRAADATITTFDAKGAANDFKTGTLANSINADGAITGRFMTPNSVTHGFVRSAGGVIAEFDGPLTGSTDPVSINAEGVTVGVYEVAHGAEAGFVCTPNGTTTSIAVPAGSSTYPTSINSKGYITASYFYNHDDGTSGFVRGPKYGAISTFHGPGFVNQTDPISISDSGAIAGYYFDVLGIVHGFLVKP